MGLLFKLSQVPLDSISSFSCIIWTTQLVSSADLLRCNLSHCLCQWWRCAMENSLATITASSFRTLGFMLSSLTDILRFLNYAAYYRITLALYVRESSWLLIFFLLIQCFFFFFSKQMCCTIQDVHETCQTDGSWLYNTWRKPQWKQWSWHPYKWDFIIC